MNHTWRKTLASALLEGVVVFVGIMGAIFANSWWDAREARAREHNYVVSLSEDFDENQVRLEQAIESSEHVRTAAMELLVIENAAQGMALGTDSLTALLRGLQALPTFEPVTKTYDNILGSGDLLTLRSGELRSSLADFQSRLLLVNVVQETQERLLVEIFQPYIIEHLDYLAIVQLDSDSVPLREPIHTESIHSVVGTREFRNWVVMRLDWADDLGDQHRTVLGKVKEIRALLGTER